MDSIFLLGEGDRTAFLQHMSQSLGCTYICLWSYLPYPSNCLLFLDGIYRDNQQQPSSSSSVNSSRRFFDAYTETVAYVDQGRIPGFALKNNLPYMELKMHDIQRLSSNEAQLRLYQESGIQTVVSMSCAMGEIEFGFSGDINIDLAMEMRNWFPSDHHREPTNISIQNNPSSSSSSLPSLSLSLDDSTEYNISTSPFISYDQEQQLPQQGFSAAPEALFEGDVIRSTNSPVINTTTITPSPERVSSALSALQSAHLPSIEDEDAVMTRAILAVLSSGNDSPSSSPQTSQINPRTNSLGAFRNYRSPSSLVSDKRVTTKRQNMFKRAVSYLRNVGHSRINRELQIQENQPRAVMSAQSLHHMIKERRRRQRINESFQTLRSLLPPGFKNDKASVLSCTTEYLSSLITQLKDLRRKNRALEMQVLHRREENVEEHAMTFDSSSSERVRVEISQASTSTSEQAGRFLDLRLNLRGVNPLNLLSRVLEFLRGQRNVSLLSIQSAPPQVHSLVMRLKVEGDEFDEEGFQEAVRRVVDDY